MARRTQLPLSYGELSEPRPLYRPRHAAPTTVGRALRRLGALFAHAEDEAGRDRYGRTLALPAALPAGPASISPPSRSTDSQRTDGQRTDGQVILAPTAGTPAAFIAGPGGLITANAARQDAHRDEPGRVSPPAQRYILLPAPVS